WEASIRLKCFHLNGSQKNELCNLEVKRTIEKDENIVYVRQSWGNSKVGAYWLEGDYVWEGYIDDVKVGERKFYIVDTGALMTEQNPHFTIESIKLFEGDGQASSLPEKRYLTRFRQAETRFVWCEFKFKNNLPKGYYAEIFFNFYNDAGQLKGTHDYFTYVSSSTMGKTEIIFPGWGGDTPGRWGNDKYTLEVVYLDTLLATRPIEVGDIAEEGEVPIISGGEHIVKGMKQAGSSPVEQARENLLYESLDELNALTGLANIKHEVNEMVQLVKFYQETEKDVLSKFPVHTGFPGTARTGTAPSAR